MNKLLITQNSNLIQSKFELVKENAKLAEANECNTNELFKKIMEIKHLKEALDKSDKLINDKLGEGNDLHKIR